MQIKTLLEIIEEIKNIKFNFSAKITSKTSDLFAFSNNNSDYYWQIDIFNRWNKEGEYSYARIEFDFRWHDRNLQLDPVEIAYEINSIEKYIEYAKIKFIEQISKYHISEVNQFV